MKQLASDQIVAAVRLQSIMDLATDFDTRWKQYWREDFMLDDDDTMLEALGRTERYLRRRKGVHGHRDRWRAVVQRRLPVLVVSACCLRWSLIARTPRRVVAFCQQTPIRRGVGEIGGMVEDM